MFIYKNYYPFGLDHKYQAGSPLSVINSFRDHTYKYNGQEQMKELSLNITEMTFRQYDNALGRFHGIDALAAGTPSHSPYHFSYNNPIVFSDPSGLRAEAPIEAHQVRGGFSWNPYAKRAHWTETLGIGTFYGGGSSGGGGGGSSSSSNGGVSSAGSLTANGIMALYNISPSYTGSDPNGITQTTWDSDGNGGFTSNIGDLTMSDSGDRYTLFYSFGEHEGYSQGNLGGELGGAGIITINGSIYSSSSNSSSSSGMPNSTRAIGIMSAAGRNTLNALMHNNRALYKSGRFRHSNGQVFKQGYYGGRWHSKFGIAASKGKFNSIIKFANRFGKGLTVVGLGATIIDGVNNEWKNHHTADLAITGTLYAVAAFGGPFGWAIGGVYFLADMITIASTGKSITENIFD